MVARVTVGQFATVEKILHETGCAPADMPNNGLEGAKRLADQQALIQPPHLIHAQKGRTGSSSNIPTTTAPGSSSAKTRLRALPESRLIHEVEEGEPAFITRRGKPVAVLLSQATYEGHGQGAAKDDCW